MKKFTAYQQHEQMDCGPACLRMVARPYGRPSAPAEALAAAPLLQHHAWCRQVGIAATPTILLNGQPLPAPYQVEDMRYLW